MCVCYRYLYYNTSYVYKFFFQARVTEREVELAALAAERIQKQVEQSSEVISSLQEQLEKVLEIQINCNIYTNYLYKF